MASAMRSPPAGAAPRRNDGPASGVPRAGIATALGKVQVLDGELGVRLMRPLLQRGVWLMRFCDRGVLSRCAMAQDVLALLLQDADQGRLVEGEGQQNTGPACPPPRQFLGQKPD